jgi:flagellar hook-length control protein FliK
VQNKFGQIITIQQSTGIVEEGEADSPVDAVATSSGQRLDTNSNYIHSHLPKDAPDKGTEQNSGQSAVTTSKPQQGTTAAGEQSGHTFAEQVALQNNQTPTVSDSQPLIFSQPVTSSPTATTTTPGQSTVYHLASGLMVPEGTVVDQMIAHFAANRRLDTGEVMLRLHPQELGEVRMAIKVEQDNVKAHIIAQNPQAQEMIDRHLPRLREALEQQGLNLHHIEVTLAAHDNAGSERFQDNNAWRQPTASAHRSHAEQPIFSLESDEIMTADTTTSNTTLSVLA